MERKEKVRLRAMAGGLETNRQEEMGREWGRVCVGRGGCVEAVEVKVAEGLVLEGYY